MFNRPGVAGLFYNHLRQWFILAITAKTCPMPDKYLSEGVIYGAIVKETVSGKTETYTGLSEPSFMSRFNGHTSTFRHENSNHTNLGKHIY